LICIGNTTSQKASFEVIIVKTIKMSSEKRSEFASTGKFISSLAVIVGKWAAVGWTSAIVTNHRSFVS
jgi:hypothetical protein